MLRIFLSYILPLIAPLVLYLLWNAYARARAKATGEEPPRLDKGPIFWSIIAGFVLLVGTLGTVAIVGGEKAGDGQYQPPRLEDGKIVPPSFKKAPAQ